MLHLPGVRGTVVGPLMALNAPSVRTLQGPRRHAGTQSQMPSNELIFHHGVVAEHNTEPLVSIGCRLARGQTSTQSRMPIVRLRFFMLGF